MCGALMLLIGKRTTEGRLPHREEFDLTPLSDVPRHGLLPPESQPALVD